MSTETQTDGLNAEVMGIASVFGADDKLANAYRSMLLIQRSPLGNTRVGGIVSGALGLTSLPKALASLVDIPLSFFGTSTEQKLNELKEKYSSPEGKAEIDALKAKGGETLNGALETLKRFLGEHTEKLTELGRELLEKMPEAQKFLSSLPVIGGVQKTMQGHLDTVAGAKDTLTTISSPAKAHANSVLGRN